MKYGVQEKSRFAGATLLSKTDSYNDLPKKKLFLSRGAAAGPRWDEVWRDRWIMDDTTKIWDEMR